MTAAAASLGARLYGWAWEARRRWYAGGLAAPRRVAARVVSIGNLTVGGTGKTTLALHLARLGLARGVDLAVVCRRYRPGPQGVSDEERLFEAALGPGRVHAGRSKLEVAARAATAGRRLLLVDDGFSHWGLARDLDIVLIDETDPWGGGQLLPAGRLREPLRALQRADIAIVTRLGAGAPLEPILAEARRLAPAATIAAARHRLTAVRDRRGGDVAGRGPAHVVTATGNPAAVAASAAEAGFAPVTIAAYRDHHWFDEREVAREVARARAAGATVLLTAKDAVRWPPGSADPVAVLEVEWQWVTGGLEVEARVFGEG